MARKKMKEMVVTITVEYKEEVDRDVAFDEVVSKIKQGYTSGHDSNDDGSYWFQVEG